MSTDQEGPDVTERKKVKETEITPSVWSALQTAVWGVWAVNLEAVPLSNGAMETMHNFI